MDWRLDIARFIVHFHCNESIFRSMMTAVMCRVCIRMYTHTPSVRSFEWVAVRGVGDLSSAFFAVFPSACLILSDVSVTSVNVAIKSEMLVCHFTPLETLYTNVCLLFR